MCRWRPCACYSVPAPGAGVSAPGAFPLLPMPASASSNALADDRCASRCAREPLRERRYTVHQARTEQAGGPATPFPALPDRRPRRDRRPKRARQYNVRPSGRQNLVGSHPAKWGWAKKTREFPGLNPHQRRRVEETWLGCAGNRRNHTIRPGWCFAISVRRPAHTSVALLQHHLQHLDITCETAARGVSSESR